MGTYWLVRSLMPPYEFKLDKVLVANYMFTFGVDSHYCSLECGQILCADSPESYLFQA